MGRRENLHRIVLLLLLAVVPMGGTSTSSPPTTVQATISNRCTFTVTNLTLGAYDPLVTNRTAALSSTFTGAISTTCTRGDAIVSVALSTGANHSQGSGVVCASSIACTRAMSDGATPTAHYLAYDLYPASPCSSSGTAWVSVSVPTPTSALTAQTLNICADVPGGQDARVGTYQDTITATISF